MTLSVLACAATPPQPLPGSTGLRDPDRGLKGLEEPERDRVASAGMTAPEFATATEREALCGFLDLQRAALIRKVQGVGDADARRAPTASSLSLLGLLKHCALWERRWFQNIVAGRSFPGEFPELEVPEDEIDAEDFRVGERDTVEHCVASFKRASLHLPSDHC